MKKDIEIQLDNYEILFSLKKHFDSLPSYEPVLLNTLIKGYKSVFGVFVNDEFESQKNKLINLFGSEEILQDILTLRRRLMVINSLLISLSATDINSNNPDALNYKNAVAAQLANEQKATKRKINKLCTEKLSK